MTGRRQVLLVTHTGRPAAVNAARELAKHLTDMGLNSIAPLDECADLAVDDIQPMPDTLSLADAELVIALGGDGTLLRAAELARPVGLPLLGINLGHVGFLTEADRSDIVGTARAVHAASYAVEDRMTLDVTVIRDGVAISNNWALNDATVERLHRTKVLDVFVEIDDRPLSQWGCDGVVLATPTGSTAYAFSAGGPVVWPSVEALLLVPISAHALFARALVVSPDSMISIEIRNDVSAVLACDGRRQLELGNDRIEIRRADRAVRLVRLRSSPFTDRLVDKFQLPVAGWRGAGTTD